MNWVRWRRRCTNWAMLSAAVAGTALVLVPLLSVLSYVWNQGRHALGWQFFTHLPVPVGEPGGGMANAIVGSLCMVGGACALGLPVGLAGGIYLAEFGRGRLALATRFCADVLNGVPSIVAGVFVYELVVRPMKGFSALAGSFALAVILVPLVMRTSEEMLRLVPRSQRDAALAVGASEARTVSGVVIPAALAGLTTGALLAIARIAGETAPLMFTAFGNQFWSLKLREPAAALPLQIFTYATGPYPEWHEQAWTGALVLVGLTLTLNVLARVATRGRYRLD